MTKKAVKDAATAHLAAQRLKGASLDAIAEEIVMFSDAATKLMKGKLKDDTVYLLIQDAIGRNAQTKYRDIPLKIIKAVIDGMMDLRNAHLKEK